MNLQPLAERIAGSALSDYLQQQLWIVPVSQSIHIISVAIVFGSAVVINLRLLGVSSTGRSISQLVQTLVPWMYRGCAALLLTGTLQTIIEPVRQFVTPQFWWKMLMIVVVLTMTVVFARTVRRNAAAWDDPQTRPGAGKAFALLSLALWTGIVICGRLIGYTWAFYVAA